MIFKQFDISFSDFILGRLPITYKKNFLDRRTKTNVNQTFFLSIYVIVIQIFLNIVNMLKPSSESPDGVMKYILLSLILLVIGVVCLILTILMRKGKIRNKQLSKILPYVLLYTYTIIQLIFVYFNLANNAWLSSYIIALLVMSFFIFRTPIHCTISIFAVFLITIFMMYITRFENNAWQIAMESDTWATMIIITILCNYMSMTSYYLFFKNTLDGLDLEYTNQKLTVVAKTDALTGLYNRHGFYDHLRKNFLKRKHKQKFVAVTMIDIDYFKQYNDKHGHLVGDACLQHISKIIKNSFHNIDGVFCRYGGEEFLCVFYANSPSQAFEIVDEFRQKVSNEQFNILDVDATDITVTVSAGVAYSKSNSKVSIKKMIALADKALYQAKQNGRNSTIVLP